MLRKLYRIGLNRAGLARFLPGRVTNNAFFSENQQLGFVVGGLGVRGLVIHTIGQKTRLTKSVQKSRVFALEKPATMV